MWHSELPQGISTCGQRGFKSEHTCQISSSAVHTDSSEGPRKGDQKAPGMGESCWAGLQPTCKGWLAWAPAHWWDVLGAWVQGAVSCPWQSQVLVVWAHRCLFASVKESSKNVKLAG